MFVRNIKSILPVLILILVISMSSCDMSTSGNIQEGSYASNNFYSRWDDEEESTYHSHITQINCTFKKITYSEYVNSNENVLVKLFPNTEYYSIEMYFKGKEMSEYSKVALTGIESGYNEKGNLQYNGKAKMENQGKIIESDFVFSLFYGDKFHIEIFELEQDLFYESYKIETYEYEVCGTYVGNDYVEKENAKLIINEIPEKQYSFGNYNQFQGVYGKQFFEIEFYLLNEESQEFEFVFLRFQSFKSHLNNPDRNDYYKAVGYIERNEIVVMEFTFELVFENEDGMLEIRLYNYDDSYDYFEETFIFKK